MNIVLDQKNIEVSAEEYTILVNFLLTMRALQMKNIYTVVEVASIERDVRTERELLLEDVAEIDSYDIKHIIDVALSKHRQC